MSIKMMNLTINGKMCRKCNMFKSRKLFYVHSNRADGLQVYCKKCTQREKKVKKTEYNEVMRRWYNKHGYKKIAAKLYGITVADYEQLLEYAGNRCQICLGVNSNKRRLSVDHNHETGVIRGILCTNCNTGLGAFGDSIDRIELAINYLRSNQDV